MSKFEVANGHIPLQDGDLLQGWISVGPETELEWSYPSNDGSARFSLLAFTLSRIPQVVDDLSFRAHTSRSQLRYDTGRKWYPGEKPLSFEGDIHINGEKIAVNGLHYRSGYYRGSVNLPDGLSPRDISRQLINPYWLQ